MNSVTTCNHDYSKVQQFCFECGKVYVEGHVIGHDFPQWLENYFKDCGGWKSEYSGNILQLFDAYNAGIEFQTFAVMMESRLNNKL